MSKKSITLLGKKIQYSNVPRLAKELNVGDSVIEKRTNTKNIIKNLKTKKVIYNENTGDIANLNLQDKPLLIREFLNINRIDRQLRNAIISNNNFNAQIDDDNIHIFDKKQTLGQGDKIDISYDVIFRIWTSSNFGTKKSNSVRFISGFYSDVIGDNSQIYDHPIWSNEGEEFTYNKKFNESYIKSGKFLEEAIVFEPSKFIKSVIYKILIDYEDFVSHIAIEKINTHTTKRKERFDMKEMRLFKTSPDNISINLFNEIVIIDQNKDENCVVKYLENIYGSNPKTAINVKKYFKEKNIDINNGISTVMIIDFCKKYTIQCIVYDINKKLIAEYMPQKKSHKKSLVYIAYNNHMYPLKNKLLNEIIFSGEKNKQLTQIKINKIFDDLLKQNIIPSNVKLSPTSENENIKHNIKSFVHDNTEFFFNEKYDTLSLILKEYGLLNHITPQINDLQVFELIEKLHNLPKIDSFFPQLKDHRLPLYTYTNIELIEKLKNKNIKMDDIITIDKCKQHGHALYSLPYIMFTDIRTAKVTKLPKLEDMNDYYLYLAKPSKSTILMPDTSFYTGYDLSYIMSEGIEFTLLEEYSCNFVDNTYRTLIPDYYQRTKNIKDKDVVKLIINKAIGNFQNGCSDVKKIPKLTKICNYDEEKYTNCDISEPYNENYKLCFDSKEYCSIYTRKILAIQLKNMARKIMYEKMKELKLKDTDIIQIYVDSITFIKNGEELTNINKNDFMAWKIVDTFEGHRDNFSYEGIDKTVLIKDQRDHLNYLNINYAGGGKSYDIINNLIPKFIQLDKKYIVLSPSHSSLADYKKNKLNSSVIQKYIFNNEIPTEEKIVIDEIGLCDKRANDVIYKCIIAGKQIFAYGDYNQLLPVLEYSTFNSNAYLKLCYDRVKNNKTNFRNNFTTDYYDSLIQNKINLIDEIKKYSTVNYYDAECIICYSNASCDEWNKKIMKKLKIKSGDIGFKTICKSNDLRNKNIYNNFLFTVTSNDGNIIELDNEYMITQKEFEKYFEPAYARTTYNVQGKSLNSYHVPESELSKFNDGRYAYTIISRLKTK